MKKTLILFSLFFLLVNCSTKQFKEKEIVERAKASGLDRVLLDCKNFVIFFGVDSILVQDKLPKEFEVMSANFPGISKDQTTVALSIITSESSLESNEESVMLHVVVLIRPFLKEGIAEESDIKFHFYEIMRMTTSANEFENLASLKFKTEKTIIETGSSRTENGFTFFSRIMGMDSSEVLSLTGHSYNPVTFPSTHVRFWHSVENGLIYSDYTFPIHPSLIGYSNSIYIQPNSYLGKYFEIQGLHPLTGGSEYIDEIDTLKESMHLILLK